MKWQNERSLGRWERHDKGSKWLEPLLNIYLQATSMQLRVFVTLLTFRIFTISNSTLRYDFRSQAVHSPAYELLLFQYLCNPSYSNILLTLPPILVDLIQIGGMLGFNFISILWKLASINFFWTGVCCIFFCSIGAEFTQLRSNYFGGPFRQAWRLNYGKIDFCNSLSNAGIGKELSALWIRGLTMKVREGITTKTIKSE